MFSFYSCKLTNAVLNDFILDTSCTLSEISSVLFPSKRSNDDKYVYSPVITMLTEIFHSLNWHSLTKFRRAICLTKSLRGMLVDAGMVSTHLFSFREAANWISNSLEILPK